MSEVLVLKHGANIPAGHLRTVLVESEVAVRAVSLDEGDSIPEGDWAGVASLGGVMGAYEEDAHPWLADEKRFLATMVESDVPVLGICLGAQLLADALGGRAYPAPTGAEIGMVASHPTSAGENDPVARALAVPLPTWHGDTFDLPPDSVLIAESDRFPHAYRAGSALAIQSHPEATPYIVTRWTTDPRALVQLEEAGIDPEALCTEVLAGAEVTERAARRVFGAWAAGLKD